MQLYKLLPFPKILVADWHIHCLFKQALQYFYLHVLYKVIFTYQNMWMVIAYFSSANLFNFLLSLYAYVATSIYCLLCFMKEAPAFRNLSMVFLCSVEVHFCLSCSVLSLSNMLWHVNYVISKWRHVNYVISKWRTESNSWEGGKSC